MGLVYPEKCFFDGEAHRTPEVNEAVLLIYHINKRLRHKKTGVKTIENFHSGDVLADGLNSKKFYDDLKKIADLEQLFSSEPLSRDFKLKYKRNYNKKKD